jgi:formamidopyrimidine-DNA glycosylase
MPELPDLQVFSKNLQKKIKGKKIIKLAVPVSKKLNISVPGLEKTLVGQRLKKVIREGKEIHLVFDKDVLALHMMLHGNLEIFTNNKELKHSIIELYFDDGKGLALTDWQRTATPTLNPKAKDSPDALSPKITPSWLKDILMKKKSQVKSVLMDQKIIRGIGNAYADEILWDSRISPFSISNKIPAQKITALSKSIKKVLKNAEKQIREKHPDIINGEVRDFLLIHNSKQKKSPGAAPIQNKLLGGRTTYFTKEQVLYK